MAKDKTHSGKDTDGRKERLAKALKANIARRKAQAKRREDAADAPKLPKSEEGCRN